MKNLAVTFIFLVFISLTLNAFFEKNKDIDYKGIKLKSAKYIEKANKPYQVYLLGILEKETMIQGHLCAGDWIRMDKEGNLLLYKSANKEIFNNVDLPKNTWIYIFRDRFICVFPFDMTIQGYKVMHGKGVKGTQTAFYNSGKLKYFFSKQNITIDGIECKGNPLLTVNLIGLYENGKLKNCTLANDMKINGNQYKKGTELEFDINGKVGQISKNN